MMKVTSTAFAPGRRIPAKYAGDGDDVSPPIAWAGAPQGVKSFALVCDDPDAPSPKRPAAEPWVHWVLFNIPAECVQLPEKVERTEEPPTIGGAKQGANSWPADNIGYRGPAPPPGSGTHRYRFRVYALDAELALAAGSSAKQLQSAMAGHVLAEAELVGTYER